MPSAHAASDLHDAGLRIQYAAFDEDGAVKLSGAEKSVQGNAWQAASAEGWVPPAGLTQDLDGLWKKAEVRHADACSTCHGAPKASAAHAASPKHPSGMNGVRTLKGGRIRALQARPRAVAPAAGLCPAALQPRPHPPSDGSQELA